MNDDTTDSLRRFAIAISYASEDRKFVRGVATHLAKQLGQDRVFYDEWYEADLAGKSGDLKLNHVYRQGSDLVVPFFSVHYPRKEWTAAEWAVIRGRARVSENDDVVPVDMDGTSIPGWSSSDFSIPVKGRSVIELAQLILDIWSRRQPSSDPHGEAFAKEESKQHTESKVGSGDNVIGRVAWSPDGRVLATPTRVIELWDVEATDRVSRGTLGGGQGKGIFSVAWHPVPDRDQLCSASRDGSVLIWDTTKCELIRALPRHQREVFQVAWSPRGDQIATASADGVARVWNPESGEIIRDLTGHRGAVYCVGWSPDGSTLATCSKDRTVKLWCAVTGELQKTLHGHTDTVFAVAWSPQDGSVLASTSADRTVRLWDCKSGQLKATAEGHVSSVINASFSADGSRLATAGRAATIVWNVETGKFVPVAHNQTGLQSARLGGPTFHPHDPQRVAVLKSGNRDFDVVNLNAGKEHLESFGFRPFEWVSYRNARVALLGDTGVGKSALFQVLRDEPFAATESSHSITVAEFDREEITTGGTRELREVYLWDFAGQPGYRLVHQMYMQSIAVALIVFDARSEIDPFAGVNHWIKALQQASRTAVDAPFDTAESDSTVRFLVGARCDRGRLPLESPMMQRACREFGIDRAFATSAKEGWQIDELRTAVRLSIPWETLPVIQSNEKFQSVKEFLTSDASSQSILTKVESLFHLYSAAHQPAELTPVTRDEFDTCITLLESGNQLRRFSFGDLVLLQPHYLEHYASAMIEQARGEPEGLGCLSLESAAEGDLFVPDESRLPDVRDERLLCQAVIEDLIRHEVAIRNEGNLVFPSQFMRDLPDAPDPPGKRAIFRFSGPVVSIYTTLVVRMSRSGVFTKHAFWRNACLYDRTTPEDGKCGIFLRQIEDGVGELQIFIEGDPSWRALAEFEAYVERHLTTHAEPGTLSRRAIFLCIACGEPVPEATAQLTLEREVDSVACARCQAIVQLNDPLRAIDSQREAAVSEMNAEADERLERETNARVIAGKRETNDYDVFLCYNGRNRRKVREVAKGLLRRGILPWLDQTELRAGDVDHEVIQQRDEKVIQQRLEECKCVAVLVGRDGKSPWRTMECETAIERERKGKGRIIPVILPGVRPQRPRLPRFLSRHQWVDLRPDDETDPLGNLASAIKGELPELPS